MVSEDSRVLPPGSFLLIVCTWDIFTAVPPYMGEKKSRCYATSASRAMPTTDSVSSPGYSEFPAYSQIF